MTRWAIASGDFTPLGGMDRANHALASYLARQGRDVHLVAHRVWPDLAAMSGVTVHRVPRPLGSHLLGVPLLARAASGVARQLGPATQWLSNGGNTRVPGAVWIHYLHAAYEPEAREGRARLVSRAGRRRYLADEGRAIASASAILCNSRRTASDVLRHYRVSEDRVRVVYYGIDGETFGEVSDTARTAARPTALFVGALGDRRKGFDLLFEAWVSLAADPAWDVDLVVVGAGAEVPAWERRASERGIGARMRFLGFRDDVAAIIAAADVVVHPSRYEAYGLGVHEALCRGLPAIVSSDAGVAEQIPAQMTPLLLPSPPTVAALVERLRCWRRDLEGWECRAREIARDLRRRSWDDMAREIADIVEQA